MYRSSRVIQVSALLAFTFGAGTVLYLFARYFKRKRREPSTGKSSSYNDRPLKRRGTFYTSGGSKSSVAGLSRMNNRVAGLDQELSIFSNQRLLNVRQCDENVDNVGVDERVSEDSAVDLAEDVIAEDSEVIEELIKTGVKNFEIALEHWYEAAECVMTHRGRNTLHDDDSILEAGERLTALIGSSRKLRRVIEQYGLSMTSLPRTPSNMLMSIDDESVQEQLQLLNLSKDLDNDAVSDSESFVSASDNAQLEFDDIAEETLVMESPRLKLFRETVLSTAGSHSHLEFYVSGLQHYICHGIPCRTMRTSVVGCESDMEFLAKVYCLRKASKVVFSSKEICQWFIDNGRQAISFVIESSGKDPSDFQAAFDECIQYTSSADNWEQIKEELTGRGVKDMSFYDVLLDFILLDAFDDLETPPYSVATAVQNRWLSARIKETALTTAIWGVLKAKTSYLQDPYGFMAHLYVVAQYVSPLLAWGFMGTDEELKRVCEYFKSHVLGFIKDLFNFDIADYSSVESLCDSIVRLARERVGLLLGKHDHDHAEITDPFSQVKSLNVQNECVEVGKSEAT